MAFCLNNRFFTFCFVIFAFATNCKQKDAEEEKPKEELIMYKSSEMANLMNAFYTYNEALKAAIESNKELPKMPESFNAIHTAQMTDADGRTPIFQSFAPLYIEAQKSLSDSLDANSLKERYNATINLCISCHKTECVGPIPRIKKLVIQ